MLLSCFLPAFTVETVCDIDLDRLQSQGIRGLMLDYDNTLVVWSDDYISSEVHDWVNEAKRKGFSLCIVSNAVSVRLEKTSEKLGIPYVSQALKPTRCGLRRAMKKLGLNRHQVIMIGDQMFTDVLAGNLAGVATALVTPSSLHEQWWMKGVRSLEELIRRHAYGRVA